MVSVVVRLTPRATLTRSPVLLDLDLGQAGLIEQIRELADQLLVDGARLACGGWHVVVSHQLGLLLAIRPASASIASS